MGANCPGCNPPRTCASLLMSTSDSELPWARIESPGTGPRTCANLLMSTSEASVSPAGSVGPGRSPLGTRTQRRELSCAAMRHVCLGDNPRRARAPAVRTGVSAAHRPQARIESPSTGPRTCADGPMSTSEASVSPAGSVGPGRSPLGTRTQRRELSRAATRRELPGAQPPAPVTYLVLSCKKEKKGGKPRCSRKAFPGDGW